MKYCLQVEGNNEAPVIEISEEVFIKLQSAKELLEKAIETQLLYEVLIQNFIELEQTIVGMACEDMVKNSYTYDDITHKILILSRRIMNLLSSIRLYKDHCKDHISILSDNGKPLTEIASMAINNEKSKNGVFAFMEVFRDHIQHYGLPIHQLSAFSSWDEKRTKIGFTTEIFALKKDLIRNEKFQKKLQTLNKVNEKINLKIFIKEYVKTYSEINQKIINSTTKKISAARKEIDQVIDEYKSSGVKSVIGLTAYQKEDGKAVMETPIFTDWDDVRIKLEKQNKRLANLDKRYVSSLKLS